MARQNKKMRYTKDQVLTAIRMSRGIMTKVAKLLGKTDKTNCSWHVANRHVQRWKKTRNSWKSQRERFIDRAEKSLGKAVDRGESWAVMMALKTIGKDRGYEETTNIKIKGKVEVTPLLIFPEEKDL